jgi:hypothetical protein
LTNVERIAANGAASFFTTMAAFGFVGIPEATAFWGALLAAAIQAGLSATLEWQKECGGKEVPALKNLVLFV